MVVPPDFAAFRLVVPPDFAAFRLVVPPDFAAFRLVVPPDFAAFRLVVPPDFAAFRLVVPPDFAAFRLVVPPDFAAFRLVVPPDFLECALFLKDQYFYIAISLMVIIFLDAILFITYIVLHSKFGTLIISSSPEIKTLKQSALHIIVVTGTSYFLCYIPILITYFIGAIQHKIISYLEYPYKILLDYFLRFSPHIFSCLLPWYLVSTKTQTIATTVSNFKRNSQMICRNTIQSSKTTEMDMKFKLKTRIPSGGSATSIGKSAFGKLPRLSL